MKNFMKIMMVIAALLFVLPAIDSQSFGNEAQAKSVIVTGNGVRLRYGPGEGYAIYTKVNKGKTLTYNYTTGDWYCVSYQGRTLYISRDFSSLTNATTSSRSSNSRGSSSTFNHVKITGNGVRLRVGPGFGYKVYTQMNRGAVLTYAGTYGDWYRVYYYGNYLYVSRDFASLCR